MRSKRGAEAELNEMLEGTDYSTLRRVSTLGTTAVGATCLMAVSFTLTTKATS